MHLYVFIFLSIKEYLIKIYPGHYLSEIVELIMLKYYVRYQLSSGYHFSVVFHADKTTFWGSNMRGQLGCDDTGRILSWPMNVTLIKCGAYHTVALTENGNLYASGSNSTWQTGIGTTECVRTPQLVLFGFGIETFSCGYGHTIALSKTNIFVWGRNREGQLGLGDRIDRERPTKLQLKNIVSIECGGDYTMAFTKNNDVYTWGSNYHGQLGLGGSQCHASPVLLCLPNINIMAIGCGDLHTVIVSNYKKLFVWGSNQFGQLGLGDEHIRVTPQEILLDKTCISVSCGALHTVALMSDGVVYSWGELNKIKYLVPQKIDIPQIISINCGGYHVVAIDLYHQVYSWGKNDCGQLGLEHNKDQDKPCLIPYKF